MITFPYASRIMMADGIGLINFFTSIVNYVTLFTCLGIPMYAIREIARVRNDERERNRVAIEILLLHAILTIIGYIIIFILVATITKIQVDVPLFLLLSSTIFFTTIGCEWFYQGLEDFRYITIRGLVVKIVSVFLLFFLVKTKNDIMWYAGYTVVGALGGNVFNFIRLRKFINISSLSLNELHPLRHLMPALHIFVLNLVVSIYVNLNSVMLGFISNSENVGLFAAATKLTNLALSIVTSLGTVMLPRLSNLIAIGHNEEFNIISQKALSLVVALALPITLVLIMTAKYTIPLFCGLSYSKSIITLCIISPTIIFIGISYILGVHILYPMGQENKVIICTALGALVNFALNIWLIPFLFQNGAAIATVVTEFIVMLSIAITGRKYLPISWKNKSYLVYIVATILMAFAIYIFEYFSKLNMIFTLLISLMIGTFVYAICLILAKDPFYLELKTMTVNKFIKADK